MTAEATAKTKDQPGVKPVPRPVPTATELREQAKRRTERLGEIAPQVSAALDAVSPKDRGPLNFEHAPALVKEALEIMPDPKRDILQLAEFTNTTWTVVIAANVDLRLLDGKFKFWSTFSDLLHPFDSVRAVAADRRAVADFIITECSDKFADARLTHYLKIEPRDFTQTPDWMPAGFALERTGPESMISGWAIRKPDGGLMLDSGVPFKDAEQARRFLKDHAMFRTNDAPRYWPR